MKDSNEVVLEKYNLKSWFKSSVLGFFIGLAIIVPGISGSTIAILFKLYNKLIYALGNILKKFASCFLFLLPIIIGGLVGIVLGFFTIKELINLIPFAVSGLFAGLMSGSAPTVFNEIKGQKFSLFRIILLIVGILLPVILTVVTTLYSKNETSLVLDQDYYQYPLCILIGFVVAITQLIPGLSASAFLMSIGYFNHLVNSVSISFLKEHPLYLLIYLCLILGFIIGIIVVSKLINYLLSKFKITTFFMICGFVVGSIFAILFNPDIYQVYLSWASNDGNMVLDLPLGIVLFVVGFAITLFFFFYEKKKKSLQN